MNRQGRRWIIDMVMAEEIYPSDNDRRSDTRSASDHEYFVGAHTLPFVLVMWTIIVQTQVIFLNRLAGDDSQKMDGSYSGTGNGCCDYRSLL